MCTDTYRRIHQGLECIYCCPEARINPGTLKAARSVAQDLRALLHPSRRRASGGGHSQNRSLLGVFPQVRGLPLCRQLAAALNRGIYFSCTSGEQERNRAERVPSAAPALCPLPRRTPGCAHRGSPLKHRLQLRPGSATRYRGRRAPHTRAPPPLLHHTAAPPMPRAEPPPTPPPPGRYVTAVAPRARRRRHRRRPPSRRRLCNAQHTALL